MAIGPLAHYSMSALGPMVVDDLGLSATEFGSIWLVGFGVAALLTVAGGRLTDRWGPRRVLVVVFGSSVAAQLIVGSAGGLPVLLIGIAFSGVAQAIVNPATSVVVVQTIPPARHGLVLGIKQSGVQIGQFFAGIVLPVLAVWLGWRWSVTACAAVAAIGIVLTLMVVPDRNGPSARASPARRVAPRSGAASMPWDLVGYAFVIGVAVQATNVHLPLFAHDVLDVGEATAGLVTAVLGGAGVLARMFWGRTVDRYQGLTAVLAWLALVAAVSVGVIALSPVWGAWSMWFGAACFSLSGLAANVVIIVSVVRRTAAGEVGRATGWTSLGLYSGFTVGPPLFGVVVDSTLGYAGGWIGLATLVLVLAATTLRHGVRADRYQRS